MKKTTKKPEIRHHNQIIHRINLLIESKRVRKNVGSVLTALSHFANPKGLCFPSQSKIAEMTGYKRETVNRLVNKLVKQGLLTKSNNRQPLTVGNKTYYPRTIYKINTAFITKAVKSILPKATSDKQTKKAKTDHSAPIKNDHTNNSTSITINTVATAKPSNMVFSLSKILSNAIKHENLHTSKLRHNSARRKGLKLWQISNGLRKSDEQTKQERKASLANRKERDLVKPLIDQFKQYQSKLSAYHPKINPNAFNGSDLDAMTSIKEKLLALNVRPPANLVADMNLIKFKGA